MNRRVVFHPEAEDELHSATSYYEVESPSIGQALLMNAFSLFQSDESLMETMALRELDLRQD